MIKRACSPMSVTRHDPILALSSKEYLMKFIHNTVIRHNNRIICYCMRAIFPGIILAFGLLADLGAQTRISTGDVGGTWTKKGSPYLIDGDINIPAGNELIIEPGVVIKFKGTFMLNVQGTLLANGTESDSIFFTLADTTGYHTYNQVGWCGVRFDPRPIKWDTLTIEPVDTRDIEIDKSIKDGYKATKHSPIIALNSPDLLNDETFKIPTSKKSQGSQLAYCRFEFSTMSERQRPYIFGGAIYVYRYSTLLVKNCVFENNRSYAGGAVYCKEASPVFINNVFRNCHSISSGGAMVFIHSGPILAGNRMTGNTSGYNGGAILFYESCPFMLNNFLIKNKADNTGGAFHIERKTSQVIINNDYSLDDHTSRLQINARTESYRNDVNLKNAWNSNGRFVNNLICDNHANTGGAAGIYAAAPEFINNTICDNSSQYSGSALYLFYSAPVLTNSILYGNRSLSDDGSQIFGIGLNEINIGYSILEDGSSGIMGDSTANIILNTRNLIYEQPRFKDPQRHDYSLMENSAGIDEGISDSALFCIAKYDLENKKRVVNQCIDLGAIEYTQAYPATKKSTRDDVAAYPNNADSEAIINLFPNPSTGEFSVVVTGNTYPKINISVFNSLGRKVYEHEVVASGIIDEKIEIPGASAGVYIVQLTAEDEIIHQEQVIIE